MTEKPKCNTHRETKPLKQKSSQSVAGRPPYGPLQCKEARQHGWMCPDGVVSRLAWSAVSARGPAILLAPAARCGGAVATCLPFKSEG